MQPDSKKPVLVLGLLALLAPALAGQQTWIVDANNGPGTNFLDIPPAITAASSGDTLIIRAGFYSAFRTGKGLALLGEGAAQVGNSFAIGAPAAIEVTGLPLGQSFVATDLTVQAPSSALSAIRLVDNSGHVHLQDVSVIQTLVPPATMGCGVIRCSSVTVTGGRFVGHPAVSSFDSTLSMSGATLTGGNGCGGSPWCIMAGAAGLTATDSVIDLAHTDAQGGDASSGIVAGPGIYAVRTMLTATGDATTTIAAGSGILGQSAIVATDGTVVADTDITIQATYGPAIQAMGTASVVRRRVVSLSGSGAPLGGMLKAEVVSPAGDRFWLIAGFPAPPVFTPFGELSIDPRLVILLGAGIQGPSGRFVWSATVPNSTPLRGGVIGLQAANLYQATLLIDYSNLLVVAVE